MVRLSSLSVQVITCLVLAMFPWAGHAADSPEATQDASKMNLASFELLAQESNPTLLQAIAAVDQVRGNQIQAGLYPNPQLGYLRTDSENGGQARSAGIFFGQEIVTAKKRQKSQAVEAEEINRLSWQYQAQIQRVLNDVRIRYYEVLGSQRSIEVAEKLVKIASDGVKTTTDLYQAKQADKADLLQARIQFKTVTLSLREANIRHRAAWKQLVNVVGVPDMELNLVEGTIDSEIPDRHFKTCLDELFAASPQLRAAEVRVNHARAEWTREKAQNTPNVTAQIVAERDHINQFSSVNSFLSVPVPVFNRNQGNIYHAEADIREACQEVERTKLALRDSLTEAYQRYETSRSLVETLRDEILPDARENLELTVAGYKAGETSALQVLSARQTFFENSLNYIQAWTELQKVVVEIDGLLLTGALNPAELGTALQGGGLRQQSLLNQLQDRSSKSVLPAAVQTGGGP